MATVVRVLDDVGCLFETVSSIDPFDGREVGASVVTGQCSPL